MKRQIEWNQYEAAVLLDAYLKTLTSGASFSEIAEDTSKKLRVMAVNNGLEIGDTYGNINGIIWSMYSMESAYLGYKKRISATKLFTDVVRVYREDRKIYNEWLAKANVMAAPDQNTAPAAAVMANESKEKESDELQTAVEITNNGNTNESKSDTAADSIKTINFSSLQSMAFTKPISFSYFGVEKRESSWKSLYVDACCFLFEDYPDIFDSMRNESLFGEGRTWLVDEQHLSSLTVPEKIADGFYVEANRSASNLVKDLKWLLDKCLVDYENVMVTYRSKGESAHSLQKISSSAGRSNKQTIASAEVNSEIIAVLNQHYEYGFKYDSIRELMRFRHFADAMGIVLPEEDEVLKASIVSSGTIIDGKVYCTSDDMPQELEHILDDIFSSGAGVIYYESLFEKEYEWMESHFITSPDMLKEYLQKNIDGCSFSRRFIIKGSICTEKEAVTNELKRVWGVNPSESVYSLHDRLPYIPLDNILRVISGNDLFVHVSEKEYLFIDRFRITEDEKEDILDFVNKTCKENGFTSLNDIPLGDIEEENYELTQFAIYNAIYKKVLSDIYFLNGKILTAERSELDAVALLKQYIRDKDECTFDEVADKAAELTGGANRQYAFQALYDDMVRVDKNRFVANQFVNFSVDEIDAVLSGFITDKFRAIRDITTFAMFPLCGQSWNHYLLESFCYKYSRKYSLRVIHFNNKNAGIIAERDYNKNYDEMLAIAIARTDAELSQEIIGQYLFDTGYLAKRKYTKLVEIIQQALELRKER